MKTRDVWQHHYYVILPKFTMSESVCAAQDFYKNKCESGGSDEKKYRLE
jgi:hypothetical protein